MPTVAQVTAYHARQIGTLEVPRGSNRTVYNAWYGMNPAAWCDIYQSWVYAHVGGPSIVGKFAWTVAHAKWFKARGQWGTEPRVGALVFYDWAGGKSLDGIDHVGFVEAIMRDGRLQTIEGNSGIGGPDGVWRHYRSRSLVVGYGYPKYSAVVTAGSDIPNIGAHAKPKKLTADGVLGPLTIAALQRALKVKADGEMGPITKKALQKALVVPQTGHTDVNTKRALRTDLGLASGTTWTAAVTKALQKALNAGKFPAPMIKHRITTGKEKSSWTAIAAALGIGLSALLAANPGNTIHTPVKPHTVVVVPVKPKPAPKPAPKPKPPGRHRAVAFPGYAAVDYGSRGSHVKQLQTALAKAGASPGKADGEYGPKTRAAVKHYQKNHHLSADGIVGPKTWKALFA